METLILINEERQCPFSSIQHINKSKANGSALVTIAGNEFETYTEYSAFIARVEETLFRSKFESRSN